MTRACSCRLILEAQAFISAVSKLDEVPEHIREKAAQLLDRLKTNQEADDYVIHHSITKVDIHTQ